MGVSLLPQIGCSVHLCNFLISQQDVACAALKITGMDPWQSVARFSDLRVEGTSILFELVSAGGESLGQG